MFGAVSLVTANARMAAFVPTFRALQAPLPSSPRSVPRALSACRPRAVVQSTPRLAFCGDLFGRRDWPHGGQVTVRHRILRADAGSRTEAGAFTSGGRAAPTCASKGSPDARTGQLCQGGPVRPVGASAPRRKWPVGASTSCPKRPVDPSTLKELTTDGLPPHLVDACLACSSFSELVGAVGPVRSSRAPVWTNTFATHPGRPNVIIDNRQVVRDIISKLKEVADPSPIKRTPLEAVLGGGGTTVKGGCKDKSSIDARFPMVGLTASVGSGKTFLLERVATLLRRAFVNRKGDEDEAAFARTRSPFGLSTTTGPCM